MATNTTKSTHRIPLTIITGFAGAGKTTLLLNLLPQLRAQNPGYKLALIKNEIGDLNVDTLLAASAEITGTRELLGDCICCTNIGQIQDALAQLDVECGPDRIVIETSGSAEPLKLVLEVNRIAGVTGRYELDGVVSVVDAENWAGLGDLDVGTPMAKSDRGWLSKELLFGWDPKMARAWASDHGHEHASSEHKHEHKSEMECLSVTLTSTDLEASTDLAKLESLLTTAPKDEVYRIKAVLYPHTSPTTSDGAQVNGQQSGRARYILNWSFGRWTWTHDNVNDAQAPILRMSVFTAQYESNKWLKRIQSGEYIALEEPHGTDGKLEVKRVQ
ncbi:hypothetical protein LTR35_012478 [Friedmanniomyces endolithicus]|nr:hypothetical protein LTR35_012478 [Friedmanniomyces endolithicus]KAK0294630.1 hypothetical protein LTS00_006831 [Friedmanniomyces endolithicus]KAK1009763.1 hypothetical protein LTR54_005559 [Friedmanniomyces endolithicus]